MRACPLSLYGRDTYRQQAITDPDCRITLVTGVHADGCQNRGTIFSMSYFYNQVSTVYPTGGSSSLRPGCSAYLQRSSLRGSAFAQRGYSVRPQGRRVFSSRRRGVDLRPGELLYWPAHPANPPFATNIMTQTTSMISVLVSFSAPWSAGSITTNSFSTDYSVLPATRAVFSSGLSTSPGCPQFHPSYDDAVDRQHNWQHQFGHGWQLQRDYIGNKTTRWAHRLARRFISPEIGFKRNKALASF